MILRYLTATGYLVAALALIALLAIVQCAGGCEAERGPHPHPAADGIVTRAEIEQMLVEANIIHARRRAEIEAAHVRIDKVIDAVDAMAPQMDGRAKAPKLLQEARR